jgi:hypothetical protein
MSSSMKTRTSVALSAGFAALFLSACVSVRQPIAATELPAEWSSALLHSQESANLIEGTYRDEGQWFWYPSRPPTSRSLLRSVLLLTDEEFRALGSSLPDEVEIRKVGPRHLQLQGRRNGVTLLTQAMEIVSSSTTEGVTLERSLTQANANVAAVVGTRMTVRLLKGSDGYLYGHLKTGSAGVAFLLPMSSTIESWARWKLNSPLVP